MKRILLFLTLLVILLPTYSQQDFIFVEGAIIDSETSDSIDGAIIIAEHVDGYTYIVDTISNDTGYYKLEDLRLAGPAGTEWKYKFSISKQGYETFIDTLDINLSMLPGFTQDFALSPLELATIEGIVLLDPPGGGIVEDVIISVDPPAGNYSINADGEYTITELDSGTYILTASLDNYIDSTVSLTVDFGQTETVDFTLYEEILDNGTISGQLSADTVDQIDFTEVDVMINGTPVDPLPDGSFSLTDLLPDEYTVTATHPTFTSDPSNHIIQLVEGQHFENADFEMNYNYGELNGTLVDINGDSLEGVDVTLGTQWLTITNADGFYEIDSIIQGDYELVFNHEAFYPEDSTTTIGEGIYTINDTLIYRPLIDQPLPTSIPFEPLVTGNESAGLPCTFSANHLTSALIIAVPVPFMISTDSINYYQELTIPFEELQEQNTIYSRFLPIEAGEFNGEIIFSSDSAENKSIAVSGTGLFPVTVELEADIGTICPEESFELRAIAEGGSGTYIKYIWKLPDGQSDTTTVSINTFNTIVETSNIKVEVIDHLDNIGFDLRQIDIYTPPSISSIEPPVQTKCEGNEVSYNITVNDDDNLSFQWQSNISGEWTNLINSDTVAGADTKSLTLKSIDLNYNDSEVRCIAQRCSMEETSSTVTLTVNPKPDTNIIIKGNPAVVLISPDSGSVYQWYYNGMEIEGESRQFYYPGEQGFSENEYYVVITNKYDCIAPSEKVTTANIEKYLEALQVESNEIVAYPNPSTGIVNLDISNNLRDQDIQITVLNMQAKIVMDEFIILAGQDPPPLDLSYLSHGYYILRAMSKEEVFINKLIIK